MYQYNDFDRQFVKLRAAQFRDQLERWQAGSLSDAAFTPLRLQNGWYLQRYAPMLRVAVPYGELASRQLRVLAKIAREYDRPDAEVYETASSTQAKLGTKHLPTGYGHFTTRHNCQYNWIPLSRAADVMDLLAEVNMHGIQTSGNCIRNISTEELAGIAPDEVADPRPFAEVMRQWSTLHPEFAFLPRKFKIALSGSKEDRAATHWYDIGLKLVRNDAGELGFEVSAGGGMGRTPLISPVIREFLPWNQIMNYVEAIIRVYNRWGRRDNSYKARIKILVKAEGQRYVDEVEQEFREIVDIDGGPHTLTQAELDRVSASFQVPALSYDAKAADPEAVARARAAAEASPEYRRWLERNVAAHKNPELRAVTLSLKRIGHAPGDATAEQMERAADLADRYSSGELRVTHSQNLLLPWVHQDQLPEVWQAAKAAGFARPTIGLLTDMIACPGGDFCALANARSIPIAETILERYQDLDELFDLGEIDLHISGCINSCGHHHSGHIGILGVDKDGREWYQITLGGADGTDLSGPAVPGKVIGPSFSADEVPDVIEVVLDTYRSLRHGRETFIDTVRRVGIDPFKEAAKLARHAAAHEAVAA